MKLVKRLILLVLFGLLLLGCQCDKTEPTQYDTTPNDEGQDVEGAENSPESDS